MTRKPPEPPPLLQILEQSDPSQEFFDHNTHCPQCKRLPYDPCAQGAILLITATVHASQPKHARPPRGPRRTSPRRRNRDAPSPRERKPRRARSSARAPLAVGVPTPKTPSIFTDTKGHVHP